VPGSPSPPPRSPTPRSAQRARIPLRQIRRRRGLRSGRIRRLVSRTTPPTVMRSHGSGPEPARGQAREAIQTALGLLRRCAPRNDAGDTPSPGEKGQCSGQVRARRSIHAVEEDPAPLRSAVFFAPELLHPCWPMEFRRCAGIPRARAVLLLKILGTDIGAHDALQRRQCGMTRKRIASENRGTPSADRFARRLLTAQGLEKLPASASRDRALVRPRRPEVEGPARM